MNRKKRIRSLLADRKADRNGFWTGYPTEEALKIYCKELGIKADQLSLARKMKSDFLWIPGELCWAPKDGQKLFDVHGGKEQKSLSQPGVFANCETIEEIEDFDWPNPDGFDFSKLSTHLSGARLFGFATMSGMWSPFFHIVDAFFGMENYYCKMYTHPELVEAVTERIIDFYLIANKRCFEKLGKKIDCFFMGNDFGSQRDLLISPKMFERFVLPYLKKLIDLAKSYDLPVMLHSCGSIAKVIPMLIDAGIDALHPLQAKAAGMEATSLAQYKNDIVFVGGVDTQELLPFKSAQEVKEEVYRLKDIFGDGFIVSPSHEGLLPNVPLENVIAMRDAALE